jgi:hypothetical protein
MPTVPSEKSHKSSDQLSNFSKTREKVFRAWDKVGEEGSIIPGKSNNTRLNRCDPRESYGLD